MKLFCLWYLSIKSSVSMLHQWSFLNFGVLSNFVICYFLSVIMNFSNDKMIHISWCILKKHCYAEKLERSLKLYQSSKGLKTYWRLLKLMLFIGTSLNVLCVWIKECFNHSLSLLYMATVPFPNCIGNPHFVGLRSLCVPDGIILLQLRSFFGIKESFMDWCNLFTK